MTDLTVTIHEGYLTIDGELPNGYRLIVHNHSGDPNCYAYTRTVENCRYANDGDQVDCFQYVEPYGGLQEN